ncbi:acetamidase/formamidase family protein [Paraburkholderia sp. CNPSo 3274]|uniref:acetamidase/formamidase family protein n=1 Tax=Paraburkholderia sp. CNPSo 3274 TaxID=2940932 RepID=UPI0020B8AC9D|nr:acetamidase/formamidase family protein [Paraburkholderia sp. CNPSo 3274]
MGDTHAAQGDGEVCGTAIESPVALTAKFDLVKKANLAFSRFTTPGPVSRHLDTKGYEVTTGIGPDLMEGARAAVSGMIDILMRLRSRRGHAEVCPENRNVQQNTPKIGSTANFWGAIH